jgi:hypothetical protein
MHHCRQFFTDEFLGASFQVPNKYLDYCSEGDALATHRRALVDQRRGKNALQRSHQTAVLTGDVGVDGIASKARSLLFEIEEDGAGDERCVVLQ